MTCAAARPSAGTAIACVATTRASWTRSTRTSRAQVLLLRSERLREQPAACVREACAFLGVEPPAADASYPPVFVGDYPPPGRLTRGLLRWLLRHERRALRDRYGIAFDA